ncbi:MAG: sigma-70 family RNA polymerase sigma factor [Alphaproteobacteria bacterium]|nr:sigma-70 family RNA polymerase sigma factor [Alphaproteobacteria bacterium]MDE2111443.1 sigma-70 family RNA polymerase sigma factor [Alphaproteobacteria bacterium]MDE2494194.1 sigma-70 family RNA polymerase sigma factor [Alphaproteobacteria bacterium]
MIGDRRARRASWVASKVMPHEPAVRRWLRKSRVAESEIDDIVQQAYCKLAELDSVEGILRPDAYFFEIVRRLFVGSVRRARIVSLDSIAEMGTLNIGTDEPSPERVVAARRELDEVMRLIDRLPARCRKVFQLRKIHGLSQREIAARLRIAETTVENDVAKGLRLISRALRAQSDKEPQRSLSESYEGRRTRRAD